MLVARDGKALVPSSKQSGRESLLPRISTRYHPSPTDILSLSDLTHTITKRNRSFWTRDPSLSGISSLRTSPPRNRSLERETYQVPSQPLHLKIESDGSGGLRYPLVAHVPESPFHIFSFALSKCHARNRAHRCASTSPRCGDAVSGVPGWSISAASRATRSSRPRGTVADRTGSGRHALLGLGSGAPG